MMRASRAHIAGVGVSGPEVPKADISELAITAATKALLDAGITWTNVDQCVVCFDERARISPVCLDMFGATGTPIAQVDNKSGLFTTVQFVQSGQRQCALVIGMDGDAFTVGIVVVSDLFLTSHTYLKDSAIHVKACSQVSRIRIRRSSDSADTTTSKTAVETALRYAFLSPQDIQILSITQSTTTTELAQLTGLSHAHQQKQTQSLSQARGKSGLTNTCGLVWQLRGWADAGSSLPMHNCLLHAVHDDGTNSVFVLARSDGKEAPAWVDVKNLRDGRERLGYNPAWEMRQVSREDFAAVRADKAFAGGEHMRLQLPIKGGDRAALARL